MKGSAESSSHQTLNQSTGELRKSNIRIAWVMFAAAVIVGIMPFLMVMLGRKGDSTIQQKDGPGAGSFGIGDVRLRVCHGAFVPAGLLGGECQWDCHQYWKSEAAEVLKGRIDESRLITVQFDTTLNGRLDWEFKPETWQVQVHPGERKSGQLPLQKTICLSL